MKNHIVSCIGALVVGTLFCATGASLGSPINGIGGGGPLPATPKELATNMSIYNLDNAAEAALKQGQYGRAESDARQSVALGYASGKGQEILAAVLYAQGKYQEAFPVYQDMFNAGNDDAHQLLPYALLALKAGQWSRAVAAYNRALPNVSNSKLMRANTAFSPSLPQSTELASALHICLGLMASGDITAASHEKALSEFNKALDLAPDSHLANYYHAYGLQITGHRVEAKAAFQKTAGMDNGDVKVAAEAEISRL